MRPISVRQVFRRIARRQRGMEALQVVLILGASFVVLTGLRQIYFLTAAPVLADQAAVLLRPNGQGATAGRADKAQAVQPPAQGADGANAAPTVTARSAPRTAALQSQSQAQTARAADIALGRDAATLAFVGTAGTAVTAVDQKVIDRLAERYDIRRVSVTDAGIEGVILTPKDPTDTRVILALGVTGEWPELPSDQPDETRTAGAGTGAAKQYAAALELARELVETYGADDVVVVGHSAGGALATYAGAMLGVRTLAYNAVALGADALEQIRRTGVPGAEQKITQVRVAGAAISASAGEDVGEVVTVRGAATGLMAFALNHILDNFVLNDPLSVTPARPITR